MSFARLNITQRVLLAILACAGLTALIALIGVTGVRAIQHSMADSTSAVQNNLERQNARLERKAQLADLASRIGKARVPADLARLEPQLKTGLSEARAQAGDARDSSLAELAGRLTQLYQSQMEKLNRQIQLARLSAQLSNHLDQASRLVSELVAAHEASAATNATRSLTALAEDTRTQQTASEGALKELATKTEGTLKMVTAVLLARASVFDLVSHLRQAQSLEDKAQSIRLLNEIRSVFGNLQKNVRDLPSEKAAPLLDSLQPLQARILEPNGLEAVLLAQLDKAARVARPAPQLGDTNAVVSRLEGTTHAANETNLVNVTNLDRAVRPVPATEAAPTPGPVPAVAKATEPLAAELTALDTAFATLNKRLLTLADDTVFDSTLETHEAMAQLAKRIGESAGQMQGSGRALAGALTVASRQAKQALEVRCQCMLAASLFHEVQLAESANELRRLKAAMEALCDSLEANLAQLGQAEAARLQAVLAGLRTIGTGTGGVVDAKQRQLEAEVIFAQAMEACDQLIANTDQGMLTQADALKNDAERRLRQSAHIVRRTQQWVLVLGLAAVAVAAFICLFVPRSIVAPLRGIIARLTEGSGQVAAAANQMAASSQSLAEGAGRQAASLQETSSSLEEISSMTSTNASNAQSTKDLTDQARHAAELGSENLEQVVKAMEAIKASSDNIAKIIATIDEIAFQTNILALNAAVEAARAGETGMGFSVVADEVRRLAQRCAQAARETAGKIQDSLQKSEHGVLVSAQAAQSFREILDQVRKVDELVAGIASASKEQNQGVNQVNTAIRDMDRVTRANAATAEQSAGAVQELNAQAEALGSAIGDLLRLTGGQVSPPPSTTLAAHPGDAARPSAEPLGLPAPQPSAGRNPAPGARGLRADQRHPREPQIKARPAIELGAPDRSGSAAEPLPGR